MKKTKKKKEITLNDKDMRELLSTLNKSEIITLRKVLESMPKEDTLEDLLLHLKDLKKQRVDLNLKLKEYKDSKKKLDRTISYVGKLDFKGLSSSPLEVVKAKQSEVCSRIKLHVSKLTAINSNIDKLKPKINHLFAKRNKNK